MRTFRACAHRENAAGALRSPCTGSACEHGKPHRRRRRHPVERSDASCGKRRSAQSREWDGQRKVSPEHRERTPQKKDAPRRFSRRRTGIPPALPLHKGSMCQPLHHAAPFLLPAAHPRGRVARKHQADFHAPRRGSARKHRAMWRQANLRRQPNPVGGHRKSDRPSFFFVRPPICAKFQTSVRFLQMKEKLKIYSVRILKIPSAFQRNSNF